MMDDEEVYRARLAASLEAAEAAKLSQVRERHLLAARAWQTPVDLSLKRKATDTALHPAASNATEETDQVSGTTFKIPGLVIEALVRGMPALKTFRQSVGLSQHDAAVRAHMDDERLAAIKSGRETATKDDTDALAEVLHIPPHLLQNE